MTTRLRSSIHRLLAPTLSLVLVLGTAPGVAYADDTATAAPVHPDLTSISIEELDQAIAAGTMVDWEGLAQSDGEATIAATAAEGASAYDIPDDIMPQHIVPAQASSTPMSNEVKALYGQTAQYLIDTVHKLNEPAKYPSFWDNRMGPIVGSTGGEWAVIGLARGDADVPASLYSDYIDNVKHYMDNDESVTDILPKLHSRKVTENERVILGLLCAGADPANFAGYNLYEPLADYDYATWQGINGPVYALIALDAKNTAMPKYTGQVDDTHYQATRKNLIEHILDNQCDEGGWNLTRITSRAADPDITGMAIQALAPYYNQSGSVKQAVDKALDCIGKKQLATGSFASWGSDSNVESTSQMIVALCSLGIDPDTDKRFIKNGVTLIDGLVQFAAPGGGFYHIQGGQPPYDKVDGMATEQAYYALDAYVRLKNAQPSLYNLAGKPVAKRVSGETRYETAVAASQEAYPDGAEGIVVVLGQNFPDALVASALAGALDYPVLLTDKNSVPKAIMSEVDRLMGAQTKATEAIIIGGTDAVSADVEKSLEDKFGKESVSRLGGADRMATAYEVYKRGAGLWSKDEGPIVTTASDFPDAITVSAYAASSRRPIFLCAKDGSLSSDFEAALDAYAGKDAFIVGGSEAVGSKAEETLGDHKLTATRKGGNDRYETSAMVAQYCLEKGMGAKKLALATGTDFADALVAGPLQAKADSIMVLVHPTNTAVNEKSLGMLKGLGAFELRVVGGEKALSNAVITAAIEALWAK